MDLAYDLVDFDEPADQEERATKERRLFMYSVEALAAAAVVDRVHAVFPEFRRALAAFDRIYQLSGELQTPQGALVTGPPGSGKTTLATYFARSLPPGSLFESGYGALLIRLRANPTAGLIVSLLLRAVKYPFTHVRRSRVYTMRDIAFEAIAQKGSRIVFVDQAHCLSTQVKARVDVAETAASDTLRELMDETKVGLVLLADDNFKGLEQVDKALADRVSVRLQLTYFADDATWEAFLKAFANNVQIVDIQLLCATGMPACTHLATGGNRRSFRRLITEAVLIAVDAKCKAVTKEHMHLAFERGKRLAKSY